MAKKSDFAVVCATLRGGKMARSLLSSIMCNRLTPSEVIFVGVRGTDFSGFLECSEGSCPVSLISSFEIGQVHQRRLGIESMSCDLVFQLDDDLSIEDSYFETMLNVYNHRKAKCVIGAVPRFVDSTAMSRGYSDAVFKSTIFRSFFWATNGFRFLRPLSLTLSGRNLPGLYFDSRDDQYTCEWLCSCMLFHKSALDDAILLSGGYKKAHFEDVIFSHSLFKMGYELVYSYESKVYHPNLTNGERSWGEICDILKAQYEVVKVFRLSILAYLIDGLFFASLSAFKKVFSILRVR